MSNDTQSTGRSVAEQITEGRAEVDRNPWRLVGVWSDNHRGASSYSRGGRPDWELLTGEIRAGNIDVLVVWEPSRATRDREVWATLASLCLKNKVKISANGRLYSLTDPEDAFQLDLFFMLGVRESGITRKRVLRDVRSQAVAGNPHGRFLYGYRREYDPNKGGLLRQLIDTRIRWNRWASDATVFLAAIAAATGPRDLLVGPLAHALPDRPLRPAGPFLAYTRAAVIREAKDRALLGDPLKAIVTDFAQRGIFTASGTRWDSRQLKHSLLNPGYAGVRRHNGVDDAGQPLPEALYQAKWPPLWDSDRDRAWGVHLALVAKLTDPARGERRDTTVRYLLSGILRCGVCGSPMNVLTKGTTSSYFCASRGDVTKVRAGRRGGCTGREVLRVDAYVTELVLGWLCDPASVAAFEQGDARAENLRNLMAERDAKNARLEEFYASAASSESSPRLLAAVEQTLLSEIADLDDQIGRSRTSPALRGLVSLDRAEVEAAWDRLCRDQEGLYRRREAIMELFQRIEVLPVGRGRSKVPISESVKPVWWAHHTR